MYENRNSDSDIDSAISMIGKKRILTQEEAGKFLMPPCLPLSIFNEKQSMLEAASLYLKDKLNMSFKDIAKHLNKDIRTVRKSYLSKHER